MRVVAEAPEVVSDGILVAGRHRGGVAGANLAGLVLSLAAQLQLKLIDIVEHLRVKLFDKRGIAGETARIEALHLLDELVDLALRFGIVLKFASKRTETIGLLLNNALQITRIHGSAGSGRIREFGIIAGVDVTVVAIAAAITTTERGAEAAAGAIAVVHAAGLIVATSSLCVRVALA